MSFLLRITCLIFVTIYSGLLILEKHVIHSQTMGRHNEFHRLKNSSYYALISDGTRIKNMISRNNQADNDNTLPHPNVEPSGFGVNKNRAWSRTDSRTIRNKAKAEEEVRFDPPKARVPELQIGDRLISSTSSNSLSTRDCGIYSSTYIVGGHQADEGSHPWIAVILISGRFVCSATIINEWWVVTAAHIFEQYSSSPERITISVGNNDRTKGKIYKVVKVISNTKYDANKFKASDIAVMKVEGPIEISQSVRPICLPKQSFQDVKSKSLVVAGWGFTKYNGMDNPNKLQQVQLNIIPIENCAQVYSRIKYKIFKSQVCTHNVGQDACQGDSGGPAVEYIDGRGTLVGIVSYGVTCAGSYFYNDELFSHPYSIFLDKYPGVFTKVSYYLNWIQNAMNQN